MSTEPSSRSLQATIQPLIDALTGHGPLAPWSARRALEAIGPAAAPSLTEALLHGQADARWEAAKALGTIADPASASSLVAALEDEDGGVRWLAAEGLCHIGRPALPAVLHALIEHSGSAWLREGAYHVGRANLSDSLAPVLTPVLAALRGRDPAIAVMPAASRALGELETMPPEVPAPARYEWHATRLPALQPGHGAWRHLTVRY